MTDKLRDALKEAGIEVVFPESASFLCATSRNRRVTVYPEGITFPRNADEVAKVVKIGKTFKRRITPLSGGHGSIGNAVGGSDGALVIDLGKLKGIEYDSSSGNMTFQPGNRLREVITALSKYKRAIPHGICADVGLGGHSAFGGFGFATRMWGLNCHVIQKLDVVLEDGTRTVISKADKPDLFWAMRGAAPSFAIATSIIYKTFPEPPSTTDYKYIRVMPFSEAASIVSQFQVAASTPGKVPKELGLQFRVDRGTSTTTVKLTVTGSYYGAEQYFESVIKPFLLGLMGINAGGNPPNPGNSGNSANSANSANAANSANSANAANAANSANAARLFDATNPDIYFSTENAAHVTGSYPESINRIAGDPTITGDSYAYANSISKILYGGGDDNVARPSIRTMAALTGRSLQPPAASGVSSQDATTTAIPNPPDAPVSFYIKTLMSPVLNDAALVTFMKYSAAQGFGSELDWYVAIKLLGGVDSQLKNAESTAFAWTGAFWFVEFNADSRVRQYPQSGYSFLDDMVKSVTNEMPNDTFGAYPGFSDERLDNFQQRYYGANYTKLVEVKRQSADSGVFVFPQSIGS